jgi:hypothetical protein
MDTTITYGFLDESSSLSDKPFYFCVTILTTGEKANTRLQNIIKRARKKIVKKKLKSLSEIKFYNSDEKTRVFILTELTKMNVEIIAVAVDKEGRRVKDTPTNYGFIVGATAAEALRIHPVLNLTMDKKFTSRKQEEECMAETQKATHILAKGKTSVSFNPPVDSTKDSLIQLADFVAGALNFKYNNNDDHYLVIVQEKITVEKVMKWTEIKKRIVTP